MQLVRALTSGGLILFEQLKEHRYFGDGISTPKQDCMALCLTQFVAKLADHMKLEISIFPELAL